MKKKNPPPPQNKKKSRTDLAQIDAMKDHEIDFSDIPKLGPDFFREAILWHPPTDGQAKA
jgi:hypothetical protein